MHSTPRSNRIHIALLGRRNAGKSSFMNRFLGQEFSIVSALPGTTTDPVEKAHELQPVGPVVLMDTAGIDDAGELGRARTGKTMATLKRADLAVVLCEKGTAGIWEDDLVETLRTRRIPFLAAVTKRDLLCEADGTPDRLVKALRERWGCEVVATETLTGTGFEETRTLLARLVETAEAAPPIISEFVRPGQPVVLVIPSDEEIPKGRIIGSQVQTIRELLDAGVPSVVCRETELTRILETSGAYDPTASGPQTPQLVVTDSQSIEEVARIVPDHIPLTTFSILFSRHKGDLGIYRSGLEAIDRLGDGDRILMAELCSHRPVGEDTDRVKIPRWLEDYTGKKLEIEVRSGRDWPLDLTAYALIIQCGGCMVTRRTLLSRVAEAVECGVPITNYGLVISHLAGLTRRATAPLGTEPASPTQALCLVPAP